MKPFFRFLFPPGQFSDLIMGTLHLLDMDMITKGSGNSWPVTSGCLGHQSSKWAWARGTGPIPPTCEVRRPYAIMTEQTESDNLKAVGEWLYTIWPNNVWSRDGLHVRKGLAVHFDANHATSPGSGGCIVFINRDEFDDFGLVMAQLLKQGIKEVPLDVEYI